MIRIYTFYRGNVCVPAHSVFSLPLIFTLVAASISHFLTAVILFSCFSSNEIGLRCHLFLALTLFPLSKLMQTLKFGGKKDSFLLLLFFFLFKSPGGNVITAETSGTLEMQNFTSAITYSFPDRLTSDSLRPPPPSVRTGGRTLTS